MKNSTTRSNLTRPSFVLFYVMLVLSYINIFFDNRFDIPFVIHDSFIVFSPTPGASFAVFRILFYLTVFLFPMTFSVGEIRAKEGSIKQALSKYAQYVSFLGLLTSAVGLMLGPHVVETRLLGIVSLVCFLYYCVSGRWKGLLVTFAFIILLYILNDTVMPDLPFGMDRYWFRFLMNEGTNPSFYSYAWGPCNISHFTCMNVCVYSLANVIEYFVHKRKAER